MRAQHAQQGFVAGHRFAALLEGCFRNRSEGTIGSIVSVRPNPFSREIAVVLQTHQLLEALGLVVQHSRTRIIPRITMRIAPAGTSRLPASRPASVSRPLESPSLSAFISLQVIHGMSPPQKKARRAMSARSMNVSPLKKRSVFDHRLVFLSTALNSFSIAEPSAKSKSWRSFLSSPLTVIGSELITPQIHTAQRMPERHP
jgi:hypothetical protein